MIDNKIQTDLKLLHKISLSIKKENLHCLKLTKIFINPTNFIFIQQSYMFSSPKILHIVLNDGILSSQSQLVHQFYFVEKVEVLSEVLVVIVGRARLKHEKNQINQCILWDISNKKSYSLNLSKTPSNTTTTLHFFNKTKLLAYIQANHKNDTTQLKLQYYKLEDLIDLASTKLPSHQHTLELPYDNFMRIFPLNNSSMFGFCRVNQNRCRFSSYSWDAEKDVGQFAEYKFEFYVVPVTQKKYLYARMKDMWEISPQYFYLQVQTYIDNMLTNDLQLHKLKTAEFELYHTFFYNSLSNILKKPNSDLNNISQQSSHRLQFINSLRHLSCRQFVKQSLNVRNDIQNANRSGRVSSHRLQLRSATVPVYYIQPSSQKILLKHESPLEQVSYLWPQYLQNCMISLQQNSHNQLNIQNPGQQLEITIYSLPESWKIYTKDAYKLIAVGWLLEIVGKNCEDDLLEMVGLLL